MSNGAKIGIGILIGIVLVIIMSAVSLKNMYNGLITQRETVSEAWAQVQNVYQRRADLIPNLVSTVKGYASHEKETLQLVTEARSRVGGVTQIKAENLTQENLAKFQQAQAGLGAALQRLMVVVERYPDLKANQNFIRLQDEIAGTENRIANERRIYNISVKTYNSTIQKFPQVFLANMFGFTSKPYFEASETAQEVPEVKF